MPRQGVHDLKEPLPQFRVDLRTDAPSGIIKFEDLPSCIAEDAVRAGTLVRLAGQLKGRKIRRSARLLAAFLGSLANDPEVRLSAASRVLMRAWRIRMCGWLWSLLDPLADDEYCYFTLVLPTWWVGAGDLKHVSAKKLIARLRTALRRAGSADATGWLFAMIHGGYDGTTDGFPIHVHGIATKGMMKVIRKLRKQRQFQRHDADRVNYPHVTTWKKLQINKPNGFLPAGITYTAKSIWLQHNTEFDEQGKNHRVGLPRRIRGTAFVQHLLWLHSQPVKDQILLVHLSVIAGELVERKRGAYNPDR